MHQWIVYNKIRDIYYKGELIYMRLYKVISLQEIIKNAVNSKKKSKQKRKKSPGDWFDTSQKGKSNSQFKFVQELV